MKFRVNEARGAKIPSHYKKQMQLVNNVNHFEILYLMVSFKWLIDLKKVFFIPLFTNHKKNLRKPDLWSAIKWGMS
jgi:hypothetical protein